MASQKPKPRNTMAVDPSWLEAEPEPAPPPPRVPRDLTTESSPEKKGPLAGPRRRETMEVQMDWLEPEEPEADEAKKKRASKRPKRKPVIPPLLVAKPRGKLPPPLPRSEPPAPPRRTSRAPGRKGR